MMSRNQRLSFLGIAAVIAVVAIIVLTAGGGSDDPRDRVFNARTSIYCLGFGSLSRRGRDRPW